jgi:hypothetical protein
MTESSDRPQSALHPSRDEPVEPAPDRRGSWIPSGAMIRTRSMELRKRRGLMATLVLVTIGIPALFLGVRLLLHALAPNTYGPAGGYSIYSGLVAGVLYVFGFIVAATLGVTAGSADLTDGMFRHLVITGRSRLALYLARIPAGLAIIVPLVAIGFAIVCAVCVLAAPTQLSFNGVSVPGNLSRTGLQSWAADHADVVICNFDFRAGPDSPLAPVLDTVPCGNPNGLPITKQRPGSAGQTPATEAQIRQAAVGIADSNYLEYSRQFLSPPTSLMIDSGLWLELEAVIGFIVGLGLGALIGQRTTGVVMMIVLEVVLTPILSRANIPHFANLQRAVVGLATANLAPGGLSVLGGGGGRPGSLNGNPEILPESATVAACVIVAWLIGWSILGAWRMATRDT